MPRCECIVNIVISAQHVRQEQVNVGHLPLSAGFLLFWLGSASRLDVCLCGYQLEIQVEMRFGIR